MISVSSKYAAKAIKTAEKRLDFLAELAEDMIVYADVTIDASAEATVNAGENSLELAAYSLLDSTEIRCERANSLLDLSSETMKQQALHLMGYSPSILDDIGNVVSGVAGLGLDSVIGLINSALAPITAKLNQTIAWVSSSINNVLTNVSTWLSDGLKGIVDGLTKGANEIKSWTLGLIDGINDFLSPIAQMLSMGFIHIIDTFKALLTIDVKDLVNAQVEIAKAFEDRQLVEIKKRAGV